MADESFDDIYRALVRRIMRDPMGSIEFAYSVLDASRTGLLRYHRKAEEQDERSAFARAVVDLEDALDSIESALRNLDG